MSKIWILRVGLALELLGGALLALDVFADPIQDMFEAVVRATLKNAHTALRYLLFLLILLYGLLESFLSAFVRPILVIDSKAVLAILNNVELLDAWVALLRFRTPIGASVIEVIGVVGICMILFWIYITFIISRQIWETAFDSTPVENIMTEFDEVKSVSPDVTVTELIKRMNHDPQRDYPVVKNGSIVGLVTVAEIKSVPSRARADTTVGEVMVTDPVTVTADTGVMTSIRLIQNKDIASLLVTKDDDYVGILFRTDIIKSLDLSLRGYQARKGTLVGTKEYVKAKAFGSIPVRAVQRITTLSLVALAVVGLPMVIAWIVPAVTLAIVLATLWLVAVAPVLVGYRLESRDWVTSGLRVAGFFFLSTGFFIQLVWTFLPS